MILADWLSRTGTNTRNPHELVPVSFEPRQIITQIQRTKLDEFSVTVCRSSEKPRKRQKPEFQALTRGQAKAENVQMPEVHGAQKGLDPAKKPEWDKVASKAQAENRIPIDVATGRPYHFETTSVTAKCKSCDPNKSVTIDGQKIDQEKYLHTEQKAKSHIW